jgi:hypothetical protein
MKYLWCSLCNHTYAETSWTRNGRIPMGYCPNLRCHAPANRYAVDWIAIAKAGGYADTPIEGNHYPLYPFELGGTS